jgi:hypothetical protein
MKDANSAYFGTAAGVSSILGNLIYNINSASGLMNHGIYASGVYNCNW